MIEIMDFKRNSKDGVLKARFSIHFVKMGLIIRECSLFKTDTGKKWISFPSRPYEQNGEKKYVDIVKMEPRERKGELELILFKLLEPMLTAKTTTDDYPF